jgi:hypothetical protein
MLKRGGFKLDKWASNKCHLIPRNDDSNAILNLDKENVSKTLGIHWNSTLDIITYSTKFNTVVNKVTKRVILSGIAQLFDPLGLIGPILVNVKIILQKVWALKLDWDDSVPMEIYTPWVNFIDSLPSINNINIPRRVISIENPLIIEVHGFCDASELAYGACVYIRAIDKKNRKSSHLLCSKSRVAPLKTISLPRLELCGALLLARLVQKATSKLQLNILYIFIGRTPL